MIGFKSENDAYLGSGSDRYYTNGLFLNFRHALNQKNTTGRVEKIIGEAEIGQYIYNAQSGSVPDIKYVDRPFAGYLYGAAKVSWYLKDEQIISAGLNIGTIGPNSLAKDAQELLHRVVGFYEINGWQYQVKNEIGVNALFEYKRMLIRPSENADFSLATQAIAGNTNTRASVGVLFRAGSINKLTQSASTNSRISNTDGAALPKKEFFFYTQPALNIIVYDATIQGGLFRDDKGAVTYSPNRLVYAQEVGVMYAQNRWTASFSAIFKTKELKSQVRSQQYGSASLSYSFGH
nr:lipid A deacylase LpxR family protein [Arcticibacter eurypsychrophilus]